MSATGELPTIWQIGTGDDSRPYHQWMIEHQIALIGSSWAGRWPNPDYGPEPAIRCFVEDAQVGDLVIAKRGRRQALAVGVLGPYDFSADLDDVEGWDMGHFRRVRWLSTTPHRFAAPVFARSRFSRCWSEPVRRWASGAVGAMPLDPPGPRLSDLPAFGSRLDPSRLSPELRRVVELGATWHRHTYGGGFDCTPSESELAAHVTKPLLAALGWPLEQIAIGWKYIDIALFSAVRRDDEHCRVVVEVKRLGDGLGYAHTQAAGYARALPGPVDLLVTDGVRYRFYAGAQPDAPPLYANLAALREPALGLFEALRPA